MLVELDLEIFNHRGSYRYLTEIFFMLRDKRHKLNLGRLNKINKTLSKIEESEWFNQEAYFARESFRTSLFKKLFLKSAYITTPERQNSSKISIKIEADNCECYSAELGARILKEPLSIFVENAERDKVFIESLVSLSGRHRISKAINKEWILFKHGGGSTISSELERHLKRSNNLFRCIHRCFVIIDSDKNHPKDNYGATALKILEVCKQHNPVISDKNFHVLWKREIENYLPVKIMKSLPDIDIQKVNSFEKLTPSQKSFFDLEKGFDNEGKVPKMHQNLFDNINDGNNPIFKELRKGFEDKGVFQVKKIFYKGFNNKELTFEMLTNELGEELEIILSKIENVL